MELFSGGYPVRITIMQRGFAAHIAHHNVSVALTLDIQVCYSSPQVVAWDSL